MPNNILKYTSKDYNSILNDLIEAIPALTSLWTSREDGDPGIVLVKLMSALGDMISYNLDKQALEYYTSTVTQRKNASKIYNLIGYNMHWYRTAQTQVTITNKVELPEYIVFLKQVVDIERNGASGSISSIYENYCSYFGHSATDTGTQNTIAVPPIIDLDGNVPLPFSMRADNVDRQSWTMEDPTSQSEVDAFKDAALLVYDYWDRDSTLEIHTFVADPLRSIELYSSDNSGIVYSLVPTDVIPPIHNGVYDPTLYVHPYEEKTVKAIQGYLSSTTFKPEQIKDCCFYVPDASLDETFMYLCYQTTDGNGTEEAPIFISYSENLLLETDGQLHFQFRVDDFDYPYIELSNYWKDQIGKSNVTFTFYYFKTLGSGGTVTTNYLNRINSGSRFSAEITNIANTEYVVDEDGNIISSPGYNPQTAYDAYVDAQNYIMTYNTLVTIYDFQRFCNRQAGISNCFVADEQYADDLNKEIQKVCDSYTVAQLQNILGTTESNDRATLASWLYRIRKINANANDNCVTLSGAQNASETESGSAPTAFTKYAVQVAPIWGEFEIVDATNTVIATYNNILSGTSLSPKSPYMLYKINTSDDQVPAENYKIATYLTEKFDECRIVIAEPQYVSIRVFPWRCCGTLHLTKSVSEDDANTIIKNVINAIANVYSAKNMKLGQKVNYMTLIDVIMSADSRIRYFDAGIGTKKLVEFEKLYTPSGTYFNTEAYFNPASIMQYVQSYAEVKNPDSQYYNYITVDSNYIQTTNN